MSCIRVGVWLLAIAGLIANSFSAEPRYTAVMSNGARLSGDDLAPWHDTRTRPSLNNQPLFNPANTVRWLRDNFAPPAAAPAAFVEFWLGDRLPGRVSGYRPPTTGPYLALPGRLIVEPEGSMTAFDPLQGNQIPVLTRWVKRIVWQRRTSESYEPGTVFYRDGRQVKFRSLRWSEGGVKLLLAEGTSDVAFHQLAELHLPRLALWEVYYAQVAALLPDDETLLTRIECTDGLKLTTSTARFQTLPRAPGDPDSWVHGFQPAWALSPLWLKHRAIRLRQYTPAHIVPLSAVDVTRVTRRPALARGWSWRIDRNVQGGPLRCGGEEAASGFGVQAFCELEFDLPPAAKSFLTRLGLDEIAGRGGCARGRVLLRGGKENRDTQLYAGEIMVGSTKPADTGPLPLPPPAAPGDSLRLVLQADDAHSDRPAGADPFDVRDMFDWLEPELELFPALIREEAARRAARLVPAFDNWTVDDGEGLTLDALWEAWAPENLYRLQVLPRGPFLKLTRTLRVPADRPWLQLAVGRPLTNAPPPRIQVQIDGQEAGSFEVPLRYPGTDPDPILVSLEKWRGQEVAVEILQLPTGERAPVDWRAISLVSQGPGTLRLFDEEAGQDGVGKQEDGKHGDFVKLLSEGPGRLEIVNENAASGQAALRVAGGEVFGQRLQGLPVAVRQAPRLGEYRYLRFAWKKIGGDRISLGLGHDGHFGPEDPKDSAPKRSFRYDAGTGGLSHGLSLRLDAKLPEQWTVVTRDLSADFGPFELTGLWLSSPDGEAALFDGIYLARTEADLQKLEERLKRESEH